MYISAKNSSSHPMGTERRSGPSVSVRVRLTRRTGRVTYNVKIKIYISACGVSGG